MAKALVDTLTELEKAEVVDQVLPGVLDFLDKLLSREHISHELEEVRQRYVAILQCTNTESPEVLRKNLATLAESLPLKHEAGDKSGKFGRIREKRLINIRQFHFKQNNRKNERKNKMDTNDESRLLSNTDDERRLMSRSKRKPKAATDTEEANQLRGQVNMGTDDESRYLTTTDDERRVSMGGESFVELSESQHDLTSQKLSKVVDSNLNKGQLYHKENDGLRQRWFVLDESVLKCYKRQNQSLLFEVNFSEGDYSAIQGRIGKMFAIRLSGTKASSSHLFASPKVDVVASWMMALSSAGVRLQDDILREVSMNQQNNNKVKWSLDGDILSEKDEFRSELLEALEFIERSRSPCILPKRSSYSFKELDVLKKLKSSLVAKKAECKLSRRKTWSAGSFPISNLAIVEKFRKPISGSDVSVIDAKKEKDEIAKELASKSLPEILTISGVVPIAKENKDELESCADTADQLVGSEEEICYTKSLPEGLNKETESDIIKASQSPRGSITAQSVPDLLIHPAQESVNGDSSSPRKERKMKPSVSLTRVMSLKASLMKNAIIGGWKRKGRRGSGLTAVDPELSDIHGCLFRKKGIHWKLRWCAVSGEVFYAFRDSQYTQEDFRCSLRKCLVVTSAQVPDRAFSFKLTRRRGEEIVLAAEDESELERWLTVLQREAAKCHFPQGHDSRSSSLTVSLFGSDTVGDSSAAEDTPPEIRNSNYCETTDKDSSDEHSTTSSISNSTMLRSRGQHEKGYVYYLVRQDTWEHCWMEVSFGVLSIYKNETKENALQRDHVALCDIQRDSTNEQRSYSFVLKKPGRHPIYFAVDSEHDFLKWQKCFSSWKKRTSSPDESRENTTRGHPTLKREEVITSSQNYLAIPRSSPPVETPVTSDSDCCGEGQDSKASELAERPKIRRSMTDVLSQITPKLKRRSHSSIGSVEAGNNETRKNAAKSSFLYYKANSGLWVKYWCVLDAVVIYCFSSPEDGVAGFSVEIRGCEIRRTSCKSKHYTFAVFNRAADKTHEFAGESTYVMYAWMRVLKIAAGSSEVKSVNSTSDEISAPKSEDPGTGENLDDETFLDKDEDRDTPSSPRENTTTSRTSLSSAPVSPKRRQKITSLDEVMKLLHEKQLEKELLSKQQTKSERARKRWQHSMLVVLRKTRSMRTHSSSENLKSSGSFGSDSAASPELDEKAAKVKSREIAAKYDSILEDERLKMLRRETLLKKRRNSLILRQDILQKKLNNGGGKGTLKKRHSKSDAKEMSTAFTKSENQEVVKQLAEINVELYGIKQDIATNHEEQRKISVDLNEQKRKELHEIRINLDISPQTSKSSLHDIKSFNHRRQASDSSLNDNYRKMTISDSTLKLPLTQTMSTPTADLRAKAKSFSSPAVPKTTSSPLLRARTHDGTDGLKRPKAKTRASQETLSLALSQIEDFEAFAQDSYRNCGADVGC